MSSIVLAHDLTERSAQVTGAAVELAIALKLPLIAVYVISDEDLDRERTSRPADSAFTDHVVRELRGQLVTQVEAAMPFSRAVPLTTEVLMGEAHEQLPKFLQSRRPAYAFIGVRSRSRVGKLLFGSVLQAVLLHSKCRVVSVPVNA